ncbi:MAG TPA: transcriptional regulator [Candidatus Krumholzibacteria bacterium]|nr:transcriptional regulator [Candidatus Krumholzibacteria bacterium]HPD71837.1 transcriptional regulator [Candidatus Krumholzibacteria bacterium]HRY41230.1 transcriptional regulator [Candidatus Krumholzibacteria bacterium]
MKVTDLDETLAAPARLAIVATLARGHRLTFTVLREETGLADGNLHVQTRKLIEVGYLARERVQQGGRPVTRFELTERGRLGFLEYVRRLREAAEGPFAAARAAGESEGRRSADPSRVW